MIKKIFIFIFIFIHILFANTLIINDKTEFSKLTFTNYQSTFIDKTATLTIDDIAKINTLKKIKRTNFKASKNNIWTKVNIKNLSSSNKSLFFENNRPLLDIIDVYIFKNNTPYRKIELGDNRSIKDRDLKIRKSTYKLLLERNTTYTIYTMYKSYTSISTYWKIYDQYNFINSVTIETIAWGIFTGIIIALILYNFAVYLTIKENYFLVYICLSFFLVLYQFKISGFYYQFFNYLNILWIDNLNWTLGFTAQIFTLLFPLTFFKPSKNSFIYKILLFLIILNLICGLFFLSVLKYDEFKLYTKYTDLITLVTIPTLFIVSLWAIYKKLSGSLYYFLGQFSFLFLIFYGVFVNIGYLEPISHMWVIIPLGIILDVIFISLALFTKVKLIENENKQNEQLIISQARFTTMGQNIADLVHQWKTPISQLGSEVLLLKAMHSLDKKNFEETFLETFPKIEDSIKFLNNTMDDIYNFYSNPTQKEKFLIKDEIESVLRLLNTKIEQNNITIIKQLESFTYEGYKTSLTNSIMVIIENAIDEHSKNLNNNKKIFITLKESNNEIYLTIEDNAGGIKIDNFENLYKIDYSLKGKNGSGIGLALTKRLVENRLNGTISISNTKDGAVFTIVFPKKANKDNR
ncbi:histidine kinase [Malaciobacter molluscorum]|uniref:sensor histidine kinase n=1 Tax=Malaciobacter molluscorum TaxID=1032072 RepID=UPI00100BA111|nr:sensor histidine kinase [Malaciobacter molluscorum]RXJ94603.1 histidine kinase [Malaciobacter molluscorum]